jgi:assimilatory nitrate reductase catalytic subunit
MEPFQWPAPPGRPQGARRLFSNGGFTTPNKRARILDVTPRAPAVAPDADYPWILNSGRVRDQWHTMTRTGLSPRLSAHIQEPFVLVHPKDAGENGLKEGDLARVVSRHGEEIFKVIFSEGQRRGEVFCPIHWNQQFSSAGRVGRVINAVVDPTSGQPEFKHTPVRVAPYTAGWSGFLITTGTPELSALSYWTKVPVPSATLYEIAGEGNFQTIADQLLPAGMNTRRVEALDQARGSIRIAIMAEKRILACLFIAKDGMLPGRDWLVAQFAASFENEDLPSSVALLAGRPLKPTASPGPQVCACFNVGLNTLIAGIRDQKLRTVQEVGAALQAGTNCGSCKPKIQSLLKTEAEAVPA